MLKLSLMTTETEKAYIAGFIDGEGSFGISEAQYMKADKRNIHRPDYKYPYHYIDAWFSLKHTNREVLDYMQRIYGGVVNGSYHDKRANTKPFHIWRFHLSKKTLYFLDDIQPYLRIKNRHVELIRALIMTSNMEEKQRLKAIINTINQRGKLKGKQLPLTVGGGLASAKV
jgi:hypothetical protein